MSAQNYQEMVNFYHNLTLYCAIAAIVFLVIAIFLFIKLKIPQVFGELTGRTAQKAIDEMISGSANSGALVSSKIGNDGRRLRKGWTGTLGTGRLRKNTNKVSGRLNDKSVTGNLVTEPVVSHALNEMHDSNQYNQATEPMKASFANAASYSFDTLGSSETDVLDTFGSNETDVLASTIKEEIQEKDVTMPVYQAPESETMVLSQELKQGKAEFVILRSIVEIHTNEVI